MLKAFFDESTDDEKVFFMAGWLAPFEEWVKFSDVWHRELRFEKPIEYFKHNEAMGLKGEFLGWTDGDRDSKMIALAQVIAKYELVGIVGGVHLPNFRTIFSGSALPKKVLRSVVTFTEPYHWGWQCVVSGTLGYQIEVAKNTQDKVDFIFDGGLSYLDDSIENYPKLKLVLPIQAQAIAGTVFPGNDKEIVALQAADMLAGQMLLEIKTKHRPEPLEIMRSSRKIHLFNCLPKNPESVPNAVSLLNIVWSTKVLGKTRKGKVNRENKRKGKNRT